MNGSINNAELQRDEIIEELKRCESRQSVEDLFNSNAVDDIGERIELLNEAMGSPEIFYASGEPDEQTKYQRDVSVLLEKQPWKINDLYERAGL